VLEPEPEPREDDPEVPDCDPDELPVPSRDEDAPDAPEPVAEPLPLADTETPRAFAVWLSMFPVTGSPFAF
jgi:hypothetical protein